MKTPKAVSVYNASPYGFVVIFYRDGGKNIGDTPQDITYDEKLGERGDRKNFTLSTAK